MDFVALFAALAAIFMGPTPDTNPVLHVDDSFLMLGSSTYNA
ncbi:MAG TPA: hypothetical protein VGG80_03250 [Acidobacteriaceae bacterium]